MGERDAHRRLPFHGRQTPLPERSLEDPVGGERFEGRGQAVRAGDHAWCQSHHHPRGRSWCTPLWGRMDRGNARFRRFFLAIQIMRSKIFHIHQLPLYIYTKEDSFVDDDVYIVSIVLPFYSLVTPKDAASNMNTKFLDRNVNEGFIGGEKKRNVILQLAVLEAYLAILDDIDSGLDVDALQDVAKAVNGLKPAREGGLQRDVHVIIVELVYDFRGNVSNSYLLKW
ncbi:hypothetical protein OPV22_012420 [Ensete ventricosum]|uniref:Uncharacterized protein n=1 Tax=Ensete ventricosum TaxID=4639 RepID=A0AAV8PL30_ENSVE|nr:hypothetical protein OPV22_012420 [Ensete ventricosum]